MKRLFYFLFIIFLSQGCATANRSMKIGTQNSNIITGKEGIVQQKEVKEESKEAKKSEKEAALAPTGPVSLQNVENKKIEEYSEQNGIIFGKTDFLGVLKSRFVMITIDSIDKPERTYKLYIGENKDEQTFPWDFKPVQPGYFFIELPAGKYKITSISIPVGSTIATENTNISFEVLQNKIVYAGTLEMNGIKEKIKLGGVPVIQPGFEYTTDVLDDREEGLKMFHSKFPEYSGDIIVDLFKKKAAN